MSEEKKSTPVPLVTQGDERYDLEDCSMKRIGLLLSTALLLLTGCEKYTLDRQMEELCAKDGGVKVYETVTLPPEMFDQWGDPFPGWRKKVLQGKPEERLGSEYRYVMEIENLKCGDALNGEGELRRFVVRIYRRSDSKLMGEATSYGRSGGDFIAIAHPTSKSCPASQSESDLIRAVFLKKGI
ncbi:MAG: hypothetical protein KF766_08520 [Rhodocyclaceae bacterium]|nr:hypothetical protein [Rhodocyclaceae bacterium]